MSHNIALQQPNHALNTLQGSIITDIQLLNNQECAAKIIFFGGATLDITPNEPHAMTGPFVGGSTNTYQQTILDINVIHDPAIQTNSDGELYTTITYNFTTKNGVYTLTWHVEHADGLEYVLHHQVSLPFHHNIHHLVLHNHDNYGQTINDLQLQTVAHIDTKNFGRKLIITLDNGLIVTAATTENGQQRIAFLPGYIHQPLSCLNDEDIIELYQDTSIALPPKV